MKEIYINKQKDLNRVVIKTQGEIQNIFFEEEIDEPIPGEIYKGIVKNIIPSIKSAFVDIGYKKNCFMYIDKQFNNLHIKKGDEIIVEILKEAIGDKGPKVTMAITVPGIFCVLETLNKKIGFSKKIEDEKYKAYILENIKTKKDVGFTIRTKATEASIEDLNLEIETLYKTYTQIVQKGTFSLKPGLIYRDEGLIHRVLRDNLDDNVLRIYTDSLDDYTYIKDFFNNKKDIDNEVYLFDEKVNIFEHFGVEKDILKLLNKRVYLKCGGYIIIEKTEAMYCIDVNSGSNTKATTIDKVAFETDLEAAKEIARQIILRNLSGIIIVDFINVDKPEYQKKIIDELSLGFEKDKNKTVIYPFTELNLVQIARRRRGKTLMEALEEPCQYCSGAGHRLKFTYISMLMKNEIIKLKDKADIKHIYFKVNEFYKEGILQDVGAFVKEINGEEMVIYMEFDNHINNYKFQPLVFENQIEKLIDYKIYG